MPTTIIPLTDWRALDKKDWHRLILRWNQRTGNMVKIARSAGGMTSYMTPQEEREQKKRWKIDRRKPLPYQASLVWDDVPQKLPYVFGLHNPKLDPTKVYVDSLFYEMAVKTQQS